MGRSDLIHCKERSRQGIASKQKNAAAWFMLPHSAQSLLFNVWRWCGLRGGRCLLLYLRLGLSGCRVLVGQLFLGRLVWLRCRNIRSRHACIWSLWHVAFALFFRQFLHTVIQLFLQVIAHLLQVFHRHENLLARPAIRLLAGRNTGRHFVVGIWSIRQPRDDIATRQLALLAIRDDGDRVIHDEGTPGRVERRWHFIAGRSLVLSRGLPFGLDRRLCLAIAAALLRRLLLLRRQLSLHFDRDCLLHFRSQRHRLPTRCLAAIIAIRIAGRRVVTRRRRVVSDRVSLGIRARRIGRL